MSAVLKYILCACAFLIFTTSILSVNFIQILPQVIFIHLANEDVHYVVSDELPAVQGQPYRRTHQNNLFLKKKCLSDIEELHITNFRFAVDRLIESYFSISGTVNVKFSVKELIFPFNYFW